MLQRKDEKALRSAITEYLQKLADSGSLPQSFEDPKRSMNRHQDVVRHGDDLYAVYQTFSSGQVSAAAWIRLDFSISFG